MPETPATYDAGCKSVYAVRAEMKLSRRAFARLLGVTVRSVIGYETGEYAPGQRIKERLAAIAQDKTTATDIAIAHQPLPIKDTPAAAKPVPPPITTSASTSATFSPFKPSATPPPFKDKPAYSYSTPVRECHSLTDILAEVQRLQRLILAWMVCDSGNSQSRDTGLGKPPQN
jgi:transcriptional regulator with XRE-family HTH domain